MSGEVGEVIILAQGTQSRLGNQHGFKQLLPLPACGHVALLMRTLRQLAHRDYGGRVAIVGWDRMSTMVRDFTPTNLDCRWIELPQPGNSSLKGIARYLEARSGWSGNTVVLLGDVIYSWACLEALFTSSWKWGFVGTPDLSSSGGELWGLAWTRANENAMLASLRDALLRHPPFEDEYQPGQLRRWISGWSRGDIATHVRKLRANGHYTDISDYTHDIDIPAHLALIPWLSEAAAADDLAHGIDWNKP